jgi:hypothetical protein
MGMDWMFLTPESLLLGSSTRPFVVIRPHVPLHGSAQSCEGLGARHSMVKFVEENSILGQF